ncbi:MAG: hypothetical protein H7227_00100 [Actinobacteria bacterium]|nr:hypothetical protein [Actinomycetota bacterium]
MSANVSIANAATKTITCYKGTAVKKVKAVAPKCPKGWTTKKPVVKATPKATPKPSATPTKPSATPTKPSAGTVAFNAIYKGKIALVWSDSDVRATSVTGAGTGTDAGLNELSGSGSVAPQAQCDAFDGAGTLSGGGSTLKVSFDSNAKACAAEGDAPTAIAITGTARITGGTGKFAGATGTLKVTGSFAIKSKDAGFSESSAFTITLSGNINTK